MICLITGFIKDNSLYGVDYNTGIMTRCDIETNRLDAISVIRDQKNIYKNIISILSIKDKIYMIDRYYSDILVLDNTYNIIASYGNHEWSNQILYRNAFFFDGSIFIIPRDIRTGIKVFNIENRSFEVIEMSKEIIANSGEGILFGCYHIDESIWFAIRKTKIIVQINMKSYKINCFNIESESSIDNICWSGGEIWISFIDNNKVISWTPNGEQKYNFDIENIKRIGSSVRIFDVIENDYSVVFVPYGYNEFVVKDKVNGQQKVIEIPIDRKIVGISLFGEKIKYANGWILPPKGNGAYIFVNNDSDIEIKKYLMNKDSFTKLLRGSSLNENKLYTVLDYMRMLI
ncbi:hypothetical protein [Pseudobutyrivibrio xylanivorans]|uniref:Uncharacterized protein n=1 Tax=Pseudobutyrivibrio xylanivorans TaxID=185007 RepID=A0A1G5RS41_PSEXY|nr:hypothetical protein [Pseudobutyrivibrio xylanivorans]SCZ76079.1 hypothetical protein SAMN02910350_00068 [Pseudobutyrivibrio xylanivorans]